MKTMKGIATAILLVFVFTISVIFVRFNSELTSIVIGNYKLLELPLSVIVLGAFVFGSLLGLLFGLRLMKVFKLKAEIRQLKKKSKAIGNRFILSYRENLLDYRYDSIWKKHNDQ